MTHLQMQQQLDHLYRYQAQGAGAVGARRGPAPHPDSSRPPRNSHSSIGAPHPHPHSHPHPQQQQQAAQQQQHMRAQTAQAQHYSLELHRQQQEQLRQRLAQQQQQAQAEENERERRNSEEEYLRRFAEVYGVNGSGSSPHPQGAMAYFPAVMDPLDGPLHPQRMAPPPHVRSHPQAAGLMHPHLGHPGMMDGAYPHPLGSDGGVGVVGVDPLDMDMVAGLGESPTGMIKYESPLPLE